MERANIRGGKPAGLLNPSREIFLFVTFWVNFLLLIPPWLAVFYNMPAAFFIARFFLFFSRSLRAGGDGHPVHVVQGRVQQQEQPEKPWHHQVLEPLHGDHRVHRPRRGSSSRHNPNLTLRVSDRRLLSEERTIKLCPLALNCR